MDKIAAFFGFKQYGTDYTTEIRAGVVTFMTMSYIIFVNPAILMAAGMPFESVLIATCVASAIATVIMGFLARYPIAMAPGMGMNAFFVSVVIGYKLGWQVVLGMVFWEGVIFLVLTLLGVWDRVIEAIPATLKYAAACGIGAFIFYLGLKDAGIVTIHVEHVASLIKEMAKDLPDTGLVTLKPVVALPWIGDFADPMTLISVAGLVLTAALIVRGVKGAILIGIVGTGILAALHGDLRFAKSQEVEYQAFLALNIWDSINIIKHPEYVGPIVVLLFFDMFDNVGTMIGVGEQAGFMKNGVLPRSKQILTTAAIGTIIGALLGTSTVTSYIESAAGVSEGGRSGFANLITALLLIITLLFLMAVMHWGPGTLINVEGTLSHITAPALIVVGVLMMSNVTKISWEKFDEALPGMLVILIMPLSYRISMGLSVGFVAWPTLKLIKGEGRQVSWILYFLAGLIVVGFVALELFNRARAGG